MSLRRRLSPLVVLFLAALLFVPARSQSPQPQGEQERIVDVDYTADVMRLMKVGDSMVMSLVGHVVLHHNGAVITCDSAIRYDERMMDCFRNVIINQDSTFVYGDRAEYNGRTNMARVFSPLIKMIDKDAVFYTYNFTFNTLDNIGHYYGGGTLLQNENRMESDEGYYYVDDRTMLGIGNVQMENPDYMMISDSVRYNMDTEVAQFFTRSYVWNSKDEFLTAERGEYDRPNEKYTFYDDAYVLTGTQEIWADTLIYVQGAGDALLLNNVQVVDEEHEMMAFGDYMRYWGEERKALLTRRPVAVSYEEAPDTLYLRSDSMFIYTYNRYDTLPKIDSAAIALPDAPPEDTAEPFTEYPDLPEADHMEREQPEFVVEEGEEHPAEEERGHEAGEDPHAGHDHAPGEVHDHDHDGDGVHDHDAEPGLSAKERKAAAKALKQQEKAEAAARRDAALEAKRAAKQEAKDQALAKKQAARAEKARLRLEKRRAALTELERMRLDSIDRADSLARLDSLESLRLDSLAQADSLALADSLDSLALMPADSLALPASDSLASKADSLQRKILAYHDVRIFRNDFQAICDSMAGFTIDSTIHMYLGPILWNENNQITSQKVEVLTRNQMIEKAIFIGEPIMASEVDPAHYNQIKGKIIEAYFNEGEIYRTDVNGNGQTYYYLEEGDSLDRYISGFMTVECADITFYFENREIVSITWRNQPEYMVYPMDKIPEGQDIVLPGFTWEAHRRPGLKDVFDRVQRPSEREHYEALEKPLYPLTRKINADRERLFKSGMWFDRTDPLGQEAVDFLRTLQRQ